MSKPRTMPFGSVERDLTALIRKRVDQSIHSVVQIAPTPEAKFQITIAAMMTAIGSAAGAMRALYPEAEAVDDYDYARLILSLVQETRTDAPHDASEGRS